VNIIIHAAQALAEQKETGVIRIKTFLDAQQRVNARAAPAADPARLDQAGA
jgi:hypothetical protein